MPIRSLQNTTRQALPRLGKLRKGGKKPARGLGQDLTYFRFTAEDGNPELEATFRELYGDEPTMLRVYLPYGDVESNFDAWMEAWAGGERLLHRCDGEFCVKWLGDDGKYVVDPDMRLQKPCPFRDQPDAPNRCKEVGRLQLILPELWEAGYVGLVTLETHSVHDIAHIESVLRATLERSINPVTGLRGIEFVLRRKPVKISRPSPDGRRMPVTKYLVKIEPASEWLLAQLELARQEQLGRLQRSGTPVPAPLDDEETLYAPAGDDDDDEAPAADEPTAETPSAQTPGAAAASQPTAEWVSDRERVGELLAIAKGRRLTKESLLAALGVERLGQITYSFEEALARVRGEWAEREALARVQDEVPF